MQKFILVLCGFVLGITVTLPFVPEFSFLQNTIDTPNRIPAIHSEGTSSAVFTVTHIVDGDTIDVKSMYGKKERIRLIGIDTPETVDPRTKVMCYGPEASAHMKELLSGKTVTLEAKPDEDRDSYGRLLRYVFFDELDIGAQMIEEGYARSTCAAFPHPKCAAYNALEKSAKKEQVGRWGACR